MVRTVNCLHSEGVHHFAIVHDSFGVHASDVDRLNRALREEFVGIYSEPVLQNFFKELWKAHPDVDLPAIPPPGNLDIRQVISSPYFLPDKLSESRFFSIILDKINAITAAAAAPALCLQRLG
jgi:DNA-directed RNA polymerase